MTTYVQTGTFFFSIFDFLLSSKMSVIFLPKKMAGGGGEFAAA